MEECIPVKIKVFLWWVRVETEALPHTRKQERIRVVLYWDLRHQKMPHMLSSLLLLSIRVITGDSFWSLYLLTRHNLLCFHYSLTPQFPCGTLAWILLIHFPLRSSLQSNKSVFFLLPFHKLTYCPETWLPHCSYSNSWPFVKGAVIAFVMLYYI